MARNTTPAAPKPADAEIDHPPPTAGGAFKRMPDGTLEPEVKTPPAEQPSTNQSGE